MTTVQIGKRLIPIEQIALIEPFDPTSNSKIQTDKAFRSRLVLRERESVLAEFDGEVFAKEYGFRWIMADQTATNPVIHFGVETFSPVPDFTPTKPYRSRLVWRDADGNTQSKLLIAEPATLLAVVVRGEGEPKNGDEPVRKPPSTRGRRKTSLKQIIPEPQ